MSAAGTPRGNRPVVVRLEDAGRALLASEGWMVTLLFLAGLILRLNVASQTQVINRDGPYYTAIALMINTGQWLVTVGDWFLFNPYPALIALINRMGADYNWAGQLACAIPAALALLPLYWWTRSAFDRNVALWTAALYTFHPILMRTSGQVYREGLYWFLMLAAVAVLWSAVQRCSWWRFATGGFLTTLATLTRTEGAAVFLLIALWALCYPTTAEAPWSPRLKRGLGVLLALLMLPGTLVLANCLFIPAGMGWHGAGRIWEFGTALVEGRDASTSKPLDPDAAEARLAQPQIRMASHPDAPTNIRDLANSLPIWNPEGVPDLRQQRLRRFLIIADDHRVALFISKFIGQTTQGLLFPVIVWLIYGLGWQRQRYWNHARDLPLLLQTAALVALCGYHLVTERILETRYLFCLIPFVFPWAAVGILESSRALVVWLSLRKLPSGLRPQHCLALLCLLCVGVSILKGFHHLNSNKLSLRMLGERFHFRPPGELMIAGPESLTRVGYYARCHYTILPKTSTPEILDWLREREIDYVVLPADSDSIDADAFLSDATGRYKRVFTGDPDFPDIQVLQVKPTAIALGN